MRPALSLSSSSFSTSVDAGNAPTVSNVQRSRTRTIGEASYTALNTYFFIEISALNRELRLLPIPNDDERSPIKWVRIFGIRVLEQVQLGLAQRFCLANGSCRRVALIKLFH